ncbi:hypothetical protein BB561_001730 [Smittium simulii]|uniref:LYC1 C-terminal domain-containing protein n=1 Tax=Smittium simulii TaxID=133385 RepID=A0A2T9YTG3_9FUNG|nr:hypothetical protein BB561_001730 [Smittium simulii]
MVENIKVEKSEYMLFAASTQEQKQRAWEESAEAWGIPFLTVEQYIKRKNLLSQQPFHIKNCTTWLYGKAEDFHKDPNTLNFLSHCETFDKKALIREAGKRTVSEANCKTVAAVFCKKEYRGNGYASNMMSALSNYIKKTAKVSNLYSDIGPGFYSRYGWKTYPSKYTEISVSSKNKDHVFESNNTTSFINRNTAKMFIEADAIHLKKELENAPVSQKLQFIIIPTTDVFEWRWARDENENFQVNNEYLSSDIFGVFLDANFSLDTLLDQNLNAKIPSFIIWSTRIRKNHIQVLRARFNNIEDVVPLLMATICYANANYIPKIILWNLKQEHSDIIESVFNSESKELKTTLPCVSLYPEETECSEWLVNENYCWA